MRSSIRGRSLAMSKRDEIKEKIQVIVSQVTDSHGNYEKPAIEELTDLMLKEKQESFKNGYLEAGGDPELIDALDKLSTHTIKTERSLQSPDREEIKPPCPLCESSDGGFTNLCGPHLEEFKAFVADREEDKR